MITSKPKISVITPAYNAEKYIADTIRSVQKQSFKNFEHIIIDDGSTDGTAKIVEKYAANDSRVVYIKQTNKGPSAARNIGLKNSKGEYVTFIDSDDLFGEETLELIFNKASETGSDIVYYNFVRFYDDNESNWKKDHIELDQAKTYTKQDLSKKLFNVFPILTSGKLIKSDVILKNNIKFDVRYLRNEDVDFSIRTVLAAQTYSYVDYLGYYYRVNNTTSETATNYKYPTQILQILIDLSKIIDSKYSNLKQSFDNYAIDQIIGSINQQEYHSIAQRKVFDFAAKAAIPKIGLKKVTKNYFYHKELFDFFSAIKNNDYDEMLLCRIRMLEDRISEMDRELRKLYNDYASREMDIDNLSEELNKIYHSLSWKATKPLRLTKKIKRSR